MSGTNFHEHITSQTQIINVNATLWYSKMASFRKSEGILVQICNIHISVTIQVTRLKLLRLRLQGTFLYLSSTNLCAKFYDFLETWVSDPYYLSLFDVEFPRYDSVNIWKNVDQRKPVLRQILHSSTSKVKAVNQRSTILRVPILTLEF